MKKIKLTQSKFAEIDDSDYEELNRHKWFAVESSGLFYAGRKSPKVNGHSKIIRMHADIMKTSEGEYTDHIDGDGLNNQRNNLRVCTNSQNGMNRGKPKSNTSGFKGVTWHKANQKWQSQINVEGTYKYLGGFNTRLEAYEAYCMACEKYHKEFSNIK